MEEKIQIKNQYLSFILGNETYALDVKRVEVVLEYQSITRIPKAENYFKGVINHRGSVIPVVDLKKRLAIDPDGTIELNSIIVCQVNYDNNLVTMGLIADSVQEVIDIEVSAIEKTPKIGTDINAQFISGIAHSSKGFLILLDIDAVFIQTELISEEKAINIKQKLKV